MCVAGGCSPPRKVFAPRTRGAGPAVLPSAPSSSHLCCPACGARVSLAIGGTGPGWRPREGAAGRRKRRRRASWRGVFWGGRAPPPRPVTHHTWAGDADASCHPHAGKRGQSAGAGAAQAPRQPCAPRATKPHRSPTGTPRLPPPLSQANVRLRHQAVPAPSPSHGEQTTVRRGGGKFRPLLHSTCRRAPPAAAPRHPPPLPWTWTPTLSWRAACTPS